MDRFRSQAVGMDIDRNAVKAVQISRGGGDYTLRHVGYRRLPAGLIEAGEVADYELLVRELKEFWETHSFKGKKVVLGVANQRVVIRVLDLPRMEPADLKSAIGFEAQDHIPMPLEEAVLDYQVIGPREEDQDMDRVMIVAAQRDMIGGFTAAIREAGLYPVGVDVKPLSLMRSALPESFFDEGAVLLMDVSSEITSLVVAQNGAPSLTRFVLGGSNEFVRAIAEVADIPEEDAEKHLMNPRIFIGETPDDTGQDPGESAEGEERSSLDETSNSLGDDSEEDQDELDPALMFDIRRGLEDAVQVLAEDAQRSIEYHYSQPGAREVSQVFVSGEGALVSGLDSYIGELLDIPTRRANPLQKLAANRSNVSDEQLRMMEPVLAVALGLAIEEA
ncbi:MAG: type IV pilus assembly protein PilM [Rubrobacteraceae bacterium]